ncbi:MAG: ABC transporter permease subunit [Calditrichaeota bacterium]|nr:ABC transporter permease subunit [Calditrichota bacterium]
MRQPRGLEEKTSAFRQKTYRRDRRARWVITIAGYGIIASIVLIFVYLVLESLPLSFGASVKRMFGWGLPNTERVFLTGVDSYQEVVYFLTADGKIRFFRLQDQREIRQDSIPLQPDESILAASKGSLNREWFAVGTDAGRVFTARIRFVPHYSDTGRVILPEFELDDTFSIAADTVHPHVERLVFRQNEDDARFWLWENHDGQLVLRHYDPDFEETYTVPIPAEWGEQKVTALTMSYSGDQIAVGVSGGDVYWFRYSDGEVVLQDRFSASHQPISALAYLIGDNALVVGDTDGQVTVWFPVRSHSQIFKMQPIHRFRAHPAAVEQIYPSPRNRNFLTIDTRGNAHLNYSTTSRTQLEFQPARDRIQAAAIAPKANGIVVIDAQHRIGHFWLDNPHPEITLKTLFGKVWYEGYPKPAFVWQSTGGSDAFEPKFSLVPLIFGTFKGTLYAMFFSVPLALLAAIYVSQFAPHWLSRIVKPTVEIMAALPSVVIGFLGGLYFAPLFEKHLTAILIFLIALPLVFMIFILGWRQVPEHHRLRIPIGWELWFTVPVTFLAIALSLTLAPHVEQWFFGGDLKQWIYTALGMTYDTRNSIVVGFALGFAVIPIIFTVAEDALSNVPESLTSASLALGASRWQTVRRVVLPAAAGGIFAAVMLGFGRAVGETMIVLMATGNTPIIDLSPFNGFRTMSACIAVEIPEAPVGGTLYRVLFLTALLLFSFTFIINTLSSVVGERLRKKYARF